jgi:methionyl-tRNA formyltransferase
MNIYILTVDEPLYTVETFRIILEKYRSNIVGVSFPNGDISPKRMITTLKIWGALRFAKLICCCLLHMLRGGKVHNLFKKNKITIYPVRDINSKAFLDKLRSLRVDLLISLNCPQMLKKEILELPRQGCVNAHFGMLPKYRGILPIFYAILNREKEFGVTLHFMDEQIDNGPIILQKTIKIRESDNLFSLYPSAFKAAGDLFVEAIDLISRQDLKLKDNNPKNKSYYSYPANSSIIKYKHLVEKNYKNKLSSEVAYSKNP